MNRRELLSAIILSEQTAGFVQTLDRYFGSDFKVRIAFSRSVCAMSIDELPLSVRSMNALKRSHIFTVEQVIDAIAGNELARIRNLGKKSMCEIKTTILDLGFQDLTENEKLRFFENLLSLNPEITERLLTARP